MGKLANSTPKGPRSRPGPRGLVTRATPSKPGFQSAVTQKSAEDYPIWLVNRVFGLSQKIEEKKKGAKSRGTSSCHVACPLFASEDEQKKLPEKLGKGII